MRKDWSVKLEEEYGIKYGIKTAGIYAIKDGDEIIYIGSSGNLYERISRYHSAGLNRRMVKEKTELGIQGWQVYQFCLDNPDFEFEILRTVEGLSRKELGQLEAEITKEYNPKFNFRAGNEMTARQVATYKRNKARRQSARAKRINHENYIKATREKLGRAIFVIETGEQFECINDAKRKYHDDTNVLKRVLTGRGETFNGWHWTYVNDPRSIEEIKSNYYPNRPKDYLLLIDLIRKGKINELQELIKQKNADIRSPLEDIIEIDIDSIPEYLITEEDVVTIKNRIQQYAINHPKLYLKYYKRLSKKNYVPTEEQVNEAVIDELYPAAAKRFLKRMLCSRRDELIKLKRQELKDNRNQLIQKEIDQLKQQIKIIQDEQDEDDRYIILNELKLKAQKLQDAFFNGHLEDGSGAVSAGRTSEVKKRLKEQDDNENA